MAHVHRTRTIPFPFGARVALRTIARHCIARNPRSRPPGAKTARSWARTSSLTQNLIFSKEPYHSLREAASGRYGGCNNL